MSDSLKAYQEFLQRTESMRATIKNEGIDIVKGIFREFFATHPLVDRVVWTQYIPGFNDGEPCEFSIGSCACIHKREVLEELAAYEGKDDPHRVLFRKKAQEILEYLDDPESFEEGVYELGNHFSDRLNEHGRKIPAGFEYLFNQHFSVEKHEDLMEQVFGPNQMITVTLGADGVITVETDDYDCGY
jgi:hypothetical protein